MQISDISGNYNLFKNIIIEACEVLNTTETNLKNSNYKIYTSFDTILNEEIKKISKSYKSNSEKATIIIDNKSHLIKAISGSNNVLNNSWQPGSTIKPILVYAPAIEKNMISPATKILDNKINISGYTPENADKKYHGFGLRSIRYIAKKYDGFVNISEEDGCFSLKILMPIPNHTKR